jgi:hypothetical protein
MHQEALVLEVAVQEASEEGSAQEVLMMQAQEAPTMQAQDGSSAALLQGVPTWV